MKIVLKLSVLALVFCNLAPLIAMEPYQHPNGVISAPTSPIFFRKAIAEKSRNAAELLEAQKRQDEEALEKALFMPLGLTDKKKVDELTGRGVKITLDMMKKAVSRYDIFEPTSPFMVRWTETCKPHRCEFFKYLFSKGASLREYPTALEDALWADKGTNEPLYRILLEHKASVTADAVKRAERYAESSNNPESQENKVAQLLQEAFKRQNDVKN